MKKYLISVFCVFILLFSACNANKADDGIGDAVGNSRKSENSGNVIKYASEREPVKAIKIDGYIFYDTDGEAQLAPDKTEMRGNFTKNASGFELPVSNNESNFRDGIYYHGLTEDTVCVPEGDDIEVFRKISNNEGEEFPSFKYIMKVEGRTTYSMYEEEYIILTNNLDTNVNDVANLYYSSDSRSDNGIYIVEALTDD